MNFFTDMTYVPGQFLPYIFLAPSHKRPFSKKFVSTIPVGWIAFIIGCSLSISDDLINFWDESIKNKMAAATLKKIDMVGVIFSHFFYILLIFILERHLQV